MDISLSRPFMSSTLPPLEETNKIIGNQMHTLVSILKLMTGMSTSKLVEILQFTDIAHYKIKDTTKVQIHIVGIKISIYLLTVHRSEMQKEVFV